MAIYVDSTQICYPEKPMSVSELSIWILENDYEYYSKVFLELAPDGRSRPYNDDDIYNGIFWMIHDEVYLSDTYNDYVEEQ